MHIYMDIELLDNIKLFNLDCFEFFKKVEDNSINLFILDLPYANKQFGNCTACKWDTPIDLTKMWTEIKRTMKPHAIIVFFCNAKFGYSLINSNPKWFSYDLVWKKSRKVGFLSANKQPLRQHELLYIFKDIDDDIDIVKNIELRAYSKKILDFINKPKKDIIKIIGQGIDHFFRFKSSQYGLCIEKNYNELISIFNIDKMEGFKSYEDMKKIEEIPIYNSQKIKGEPYKTKGNGVCDIYNTKRINNENKGDRHPTSIIDHESMYIFKESKGTYNAQKTEGHKPYKKKNNGVCDIYNINRLDNENKGVRHPTSIIEKDYGMINGGYYRGEGKKPFKRMANDPNSSHPTSIIEKDYEGETILEFNNPHKTIHRTQKPVDLIEWLIKSYSNEDDLVCDFTFGSGSVPISCLNTKRKFIGCERDLEIYNSAENRILDLFEI